MLASSFTAALIDSSILFAAFKPQNRIDSMIIMIMTMMMIIILITMALRVRCFSFPKNLYCQYPIITILGMVLLPTYFSSLPRAILISSQRQDISLIWSAVSSDSHPSKTVLQISVPLYSIAQYG